MKLDFLLNGQNQYIDVPPGETLLKILRSNLGIKSVHSGCGEGHCGSCTVLMNDHLAASCMIPAFHLKQKQIETVEYFLTTDEFVDIEWAFLKTGFLPCKYCAGTKVLMAEAILREFETPQEEDMRSYITRTWCTCTAPGPFFRAVSEASARRKRRAHGTRR